jgi:hypothetical protein
MTTDNSTQASAETSVSEIHLGSKKAYVLREGDNVRILVECRETNLCVNIDLSFKVLERILARRQPGEHIQDIVPAMRPELREVLITGTTPCEFDRGLAARLSRGFKGWANLSPQKRKLLTDLGYDVPTFDE